MKARLSADLGDPQLLKLLKAEANDQGSSIREVLITALEGFFAHRVESKQLMRATEVVFDEWEDPRDKDYDKL